MSSDRDLDPIRRWMDASPSLQEVLMDVADASRVTPPELHSAVVAGSPDEVLRLLRCEKAEKGPALLLAAKSNRTHIASVILDEIEPDKVDYVDYYGRSSLHYAVMNDSYDLTELLLQSGANINLVSQTMIIPLHPAISSGNVRMVSMLLGRGASMDSPVGQGRNALDHAIMNGRTEMIATLLSYGADINKSGLNDHSPLSYALWMDQEDCVRKLMEFDADSRAFHTYDLVSGDAKAFSLKKKVVAQFRWEIPSVIDQVRESFPHRNLMDSMLQFVTIIGSGSDYDCSTCQEFLTKKWPVFGVTLFESLICILLNPEDMDPNHALSAIGAHVWQLTEDRLIMYFSMDCQYQRDIIDAMRWICALIRPNPHRLDGPSHMEWQLSKAPKGFWVGEGEWKMAVSYFTLHPLENFQTNVISRDAMCWTHLFDTAVVVDYPVRRDWGRGLELSFDMMVHLASVENYYRLDSGIILLGYFTALVPIEKDSESESIQWHLEFVDGTEDCLCPTDLGSTIGGWFKTQDKAVLQQAKCFLGWSEEAFIALGTRDLLARGRLRASESTSEKHRGARPEGFEAGIQTGFTLGPISLAPKITSSWVFHSTVQHFSAPSSYVQAVNLSRGKVALVIDSKTKQAWLVPFLSLALHLCHRYWQEFEEDILLDPVPFAIPSTGSSATDEAAPAYDAIINKGHQVVFDCVEEVETLRSLFLRINSNLLATARTSERPKRNCIFASELIDIVKEPSRGSALKEISVPSVTKAWQPLVNTVDYVGVCADLGPAIQPTGFGASNCIGCYTLPEDKFYLAAHMWCLDQLAQKAGGGLDDIPQGVCKLGDGLVWKTESFQWANCMVNNTHVPVWGEIQRESVLQQVLKNYQDNKSFGMQGIACSTSISKRGVAVFGAEDSPKLFENIVAFRQKLQGLVL